MGYSYFAAIRDTLLQAIHQQNFKYGAFKSQVPNAPPHLPVLQIFDALINSDRLTRNEKGILIEPKNVLFKLKLKLKFPDHYGRETELMDVLECLGPMERLMGMFSADAKAQGIYLPPTMLQTINSDGTVGETHLCRDGSKKTYQGGTPCVIPEALEGFNEKPNGAAKMWRDNFKFKTTQARAGLDYGHSRTSHRGKFSYSL